MNKKKISFGSVFSRLFFRIPLSEKIIFAKHLSMMVNAGMTVVEGTRLLRKQIKGKIFGSILDKVIADLEGGQFLHSSLRQFQYAFGELFIDLVEIGETSGTLSENLNYLSMELRKSQELRSKVRSATIYPIIVLSATGGISAILVFFILPKIIPIFYSLNIKLPITTRVLIGVTTFSLNYYVWVIVGLAVFIVALLLLVRIPIIKYFWHRSIIAMPFAGKISISYNMANITRTMALLLKSGIKIVEAASITSNIVNNSVYKKSLLLICEEVKRGGPLHKYMEEHSSIFPPTISRMIEVGENTGDLESNLFYLANFYEGEVDEMTKNLSTVIEPLLLIIMGVIVGFVALAIITPIYGITQNIKMR